MAEKEEGRRMRVALRPRTRNKKSCRQKPSAGEEEEGGSGVPCRPPRPERGVRPPLLRRTRPRPSPRFGAMKSEAKGSRRNVETDGGKQTREKPIYSAKKPRRGKAKRYPHLIQRLKRRRRFKIRGQRYSST